MCDKYQNTISLTLIIQILVLHIISKKRPNDRINHPPVKLNIDQTRGIKPTKQSKAYDISLHLREPARKEILDMLEAGVIEAAEPEATGWSRMAFPRKKPGSDPIKVRWVTDFRDLNRALDRPYGEGSHHHRY